MNDNISRSESDTAPGARLKALINSPDITIAPGIYDGFSARLVEKMGFKTGAISGAGTSESRLGWADRDTVQMLMNGRSVIPQTVVISAEGRLVSHWNGYGGESRSRLRDAIDRALGEKASLTQPLLRDLIFD